jgi:riboflavin synthase
LRSLRTQSEVNLERALALGDRLGGHLVSGHVDCLATVADVKPVGQSKIYRLHFPEEWSIYVVTKGSVALDGISLTVNHCGTGFLEVNIIPATQKETNMSGWAPGTEVNMELDMIAKYVRQMLTPFRQKDQAGKHSGLSEDFLREHGFD